MGCATEGDAEQIANAFPTCSMRWKLQWPVVKSVLDMVTAPETERLAEMLCVSFNNVNGFTSSSLQVMVQNKTEISLPVAPYFPLGRGDAVLGCRSSADAASIVEIFRGRARRWCPGKVRLGLLETVPSTSGAPSVPSDDTEIQVHWPVDVETQEPRSVSSMLEVDPLDAEHLCVHLTALDTQREPRGLRQEIEERTGVKLPTDPVLYGRSATVGCECLADAQKVLGLFPDSSAHWRCLWPSKKSVLKIMNTPGKKGLSEALCVFILNVNGQDGDIVQNEIEQKANITLPAMPYIPSGKTFAFVGCRERADVVKVFQSFPNQARPYKAQAYEPRSAAVS